MTSINEKGFKTLITVQFSVSHLSKIFFTRITAIATVGVLNLELP